MSAQGLGCAKTPALAPHVEISLINCISESQNILHTRGSMPCWRIVFSTFRGCISFYTGRVIRAAFSASSRLFDLKNEATRLKKRNISATILADVTPPDRLQCCIGLTRL